MHEYNTKQRQKLLTYLSRHADEQLTAKEMAAALESDGVSLSAVYRNLAALETAGKVRRSSKSGSREVFYQYTAAEECREHLHLSCKKCGRTFHMASEDTDALIDAVAERQLFTIDRGDTVLYGLCRDCRK